MATSLRPSQSDFDVLVPSDDVATDIPGEQRMASARAIKRIVTEIGASAAWLAWQIEAEEILLHEARSQLDAIGENVTRYESRLPAVLYEQIVFTLAEAQSAAAKSDLATVVQSTRDIRTLADQYRIAAMTS
jgi:hypothetical protein